MNPGKRISVQGGRNTIVLNGKGIRTFWCNNSKFEMRIGRLHGDQKGTVISADGQWSGDQFFRHSDGLPIWVVKNKKTGQTMTFVANNRPEARMPAPNKQPLTWDRRKIVEYSGPLAKPVRCARLWDPYACLLQSPSFAHLPSCSIYCALLTAFLSSIARRCGF